MGLIRILPDRVANQIAAGEVVERPVAVVKELVENSLDAEASRIEVEFAQGGKALVRVTDNGSGMTPDDALLSLERHATSKLKDADDLSRIRTFGFRGEALPSIASVSRFTLRTRRPESIEGTEIVVNAGRHVATRACGMPPGTCVEVASLFHGVPARRKFLKTDGTEAAHIILLVKLLAVAHPEVAFTLVEDGRQVFRSPTAPTLKDRVREVFGRSLADELIPLEPASGTHDPSGLVVSGLILAPGTGRTSRADIHTYVNRRPVESRLLAGAVVEAYHSWVPKGRFPAVFLFIEADPAAVDVNVHPAKREVRFRDDPGTRRLVMLSILDRLRAHAGMAGQAGVPGPWAEVAPGSSFAGRPAAPFAQQTPLPEGLPGALPGPLPGDAPPPPGQIRPDPLAIGRGLADRLRPVVPPPGDPVRRLAADLLAARSPGTPEATRPTPPAPDHAPSGGVAATSPAPSPAPAEAPRGWSFLGALHVRWGVFQTPAGLTLVDRHAARARIAFESASSALATGSVSSQPLLFPVPLEPDPLASDALERHRALLASHGFVIESLGRHFFRLEAVPGWLDPIDAHGVMLDLLADLREGGTRASGRDLAAEALAKRAARAAGLREQASDATTWSALARDLLRCTNPLADPEGRPTLVEWTLADLERRFGLRR